MVLVHIIVKLIKLKMVCGRKSYQRKSLGDWKNKRKWTNLNIQIVDDHPSV
jgi:hypothetical protein